MDRRVRSCIRWPEAQVIESQLRRYSPAAPLVLATDYFPRAGGGGAVILRSLLGEDRSSVVWASPSFFEPISPSEVPLVQGSSIARRILRRRSESVDTLLAHRLASELLALAGQRHARALWLVLHGAMVATAAKVVRSAPLPVHLTVHDDPVGVALMSRRHRLLAPLIQHHLRIALRGARSVDVISDGMADRYRRLYGVAPVVVHRAVPGPVPEGPAYADAGALEIGVLGNTYGYDQLRLLAQALEGAARQISRRGRLVIIGQSVGERLRDDVGDRIDVEVTGHLDEPQAVDRLRRSFCLYLNYPFSPRAAVFRQTSFPTKLSTYLLAARPILAHAPADSSISSLKHRADYVAWWGADTVHEGITRILDLWRSPAARQSCHQAAEQVRRQHYDESTNRARMSQLLDGLVSQA